MNAWLSILLAFIAISAGAAEPVTVRPPWHLTDVYWKPARTVVCERFSVDVTIEGEIPEGLPLYIAPFGGGEGCTVNGVQCYGGLQTRPDGGNRGDRYVRPLGMPGFIFSRWGERSFDALRMAADGACQSSGHEGDFISVRVRHAWKPGRYRYELRGLDRETVTGQPNRWVGVFVHDLDADREVYTGSIRFPGDALVMGQTLTSFVEIYGAPLTTDRVPPLKITIGGHLADGKPVEIAESVAYHPREFPLHATAEPVGRTAVRILTGPEEKQGRRHYRLWGPER